MASNGAALPILDDDAITAFFGGDAAAMRRYRVLHAFLVLRLPQRDVGARYDISERSVRNVLQTYRQGDGLAALRSRPATTRRAATRPTEAHEAALAAALADEPYAGGDQLWRRAQAALCAEGAALSRRTAYRMLARLRAHTRQPAQHDDLISTLRGALPLLLEDPPLSLGISALAQRLLPHEDDRLLRGTVLQQALRDALNRLRPGGTVSTVDRSWWPYLICTGEYEADQRRAELQQALALSTSTYSRAKRQGLAQIARMLPGMVTTLLEASPALAGRRLPRTPDFIGRREAQSYYAWRLQTEGIAHIWGLPGSGKTALAAELAAEGRRHGQAVLWHTCRPGPHATLFNIVKGMAEALASAGNDALWQRLNAAPATPRPPAMLIDMLLEHLHARPVVIVLDDVHHLTSDEALRLLAALKQLVADASARMVLIGHTRPAAGDWPPLAGLSQREAQLLWDGLPALPKAEWDALYHATLGLPQPLCRAAAAQRRAEHLAHGEGWRAAVLAWAREALWDDLAAHEQWLLAAVYALNDAAHGTPDLRVLALTADDQRVWQQLEQRGMIERGGTQARIHGALQLPVVEFLRATPALHAELAQRRQQLAASEHSADAPAGHLYNPTAMSHAAQHPPDNGDLLTRVRTALQHSAAYLEHHHDDHDARQLALELAALSAALPDLMRPQHA